MGLSRATLQGLSEARLRDAIMLCENARYGSAYYLAGYAVEFGLKACIARQIRSEEIPEKTLIQKVFSHEFPKLVGLAGLQSELTGAQQADDRFQAYWALVVEWNPESRYEVIEPVSAQQLIQAIGDADHGVLQWIRRHW